MVNDTAEIIHLKKILESNRLKALKRKVKNNPDLFTQPKYYS